MTGQYHNCFLPKQKQSAWSNLYCWIHAENFLLNPGSKSFLTTNCCWRIWLGQKSFCIQSPASGLQKSGKKAFEWQADLFSSHAIQGIARDSRLPHQNSGQLTIFTRSEGCDVSSHHCAVFHTRTTRDLFLVRTPVGFGFFRQLRHWLMLELWSWDHVLHVMWQWNSRIPLKAVLTLHLLG